MDEYKEIELPYNRRQFEVMAEINKMCSDADIPLYSNLISEKMRIMVLNKEKPTNLVEWAVQWLAGNPHNPCYEHLAKWVLEIQRKVNQTPNAIELTGDA